MFERTRLALVLLAGFSRLSSHPADSLAPSMAHSTMFALAYPTTACRGRVGARVQQGRRLREGLQETGNARNILSSHP